MSKLKISPSLTELNQVSTDLIVTPEELGDWLNLSSTFVMNNQALLESLIKTATNNIEKYTWVSLRRKTFRAYFLLDCYVITALLNEHSYVSLERSPILSLSDITKIEYLSNNTWVEFDKGTNFSEGVYENVTERLTSRKWANLHFKQTVNYQELFNANKIRITFLAGYDVNETEEVKKIPEEFKTAIKIIAAFHFTYRGDCSGNTSCSINGYPVPCEAKSLLDGLSISKTTVGQYYALC